MSWFASPRNTSHGPICPPKAISTISYSLLELSCLYSICSIFWIALQKYIYHCSAVSNFPSFYYTALSYLLF